MRRVSRIAGLFLLLMVPVLAIGEEFNPAAYTAITQGELVKAPEVHAGKKFQVTDTYQFCGSDFCIQIREKNIDTRNYYCITLGLCMIRFYIQKDHPDAELAANLKKGTRVTIYGTFNYMGSNYRYMVVDRLVVEKGK